jgi:uncharacterized protein YdeI (YjbR/CyaY-like superfamily)
MTERQVLDARTAQQWEEWLEHNHGAANEIWLRLLNKNAPEPGMSYSEAVEIALCFGWIENGDVPLRPASTIEAYWRSRRFPLDDYVFSV